jgi:hypothetical protein
MGDKANAKQIDPYKELSAISVRPSSSLLERI